MTVTVGESLSPWTRLRQAATVKWKSLRLCPWQSRCRARGSHDPSLGYVLLVPGPLHIKLPPSSSGRTSENIFASLISFFLCTYGNTKGVNFKSRNPYSGYLNGRAQPLSLSDGVPVEWQAHECNYTSSETDRLPSATTWASRPPRAHLTVTAL